MGKRRGIYSVRSAYGLAMSLGNQVTEREREEIWVSLWKIKAPPKILNFIWRSLRGCLPSRANLLRRHVPITTSVCPVCFYVVETDVHVLLECKFAIEVWSHSGVGCASAGLGL